MQRRRLPSRTLRFNMAYMAFVVAFASVPASAQTLAHPHWAGSGVTTEPWWLRAVFYRIDPARFQDSDGDGRGDLPGIAQRLSYIQSLGVDAILLDPNMDPGTDGDTTAAVSTDDFGTLAREAANYRLRLLVSLPLADRSHHLLPDPVILATARRWLAQGAAGLLLDDAATHALSTDTVRAAGLLHQLHLLCAGVPGDRLLVAISSGLEDPTLDRALDAAVQLRAGASIGRQPASAGRLRIQLQSLLREDRPPASRSRSSTSALLLRAAPLAASDDGLQRTLATALLGARAAVLIDFGQELGELSLPSTAYPLMQWTPANLTLPPPPQSQSQSQSRPEPTRPVEEYGAYHPYVPPPPRSLLPAPRAPQVELTDAPPPVPPERMPGYTTAARKADIASLLPANASSANVLTQDSDPASLLNLYRRLIQLHHGDPTLRNGATVFLQYDTLNALVWVRRAPAAVRTSYDIVAICNLSPQQSVLFLEEDLAALHVRPGALRNLISTGPSPLSVGNTSFIKLPPHSVFLGELYR